MYMFQVILEINDNIHLFLFKGVLKNIGDIQAPILLHGSGSHY